MIYKTSKILEALKENMEGLTKEEIIDKAKISKSSFNRLISRHDGLIGKLENGKYIYVNPFCRMKDVILGLSQIKDKNELLREYAKYKIAHDLLTEKQQVVIAKYYQEYLKLSEGIN